MAKVQPPTEFASPAGESQPIVMVGLGPQNSGKSTALRGVIYRAHEAGRHPLICDGDRNDAYLTGVFGHEQPDGTFTGVSRPAFADDTSVTEWLDETLARVDRERQSIVLDMGGGDRVLPNYAREREMVDMLAGAGIRLVAWHMILPDPTDLTVLEEMEEVLAPEQTILVLNAGPTGDARPADVVFRHVRAAPSYRAALARGAREILMPTLPCMADVGRLTFQQAAARPSPLGLTKGQMALTFWRRFSGQLETVADCLV